MIIYLPPNFDDYSPNIPVKCLKSREPQVMITRIYKSPKNTLIIYQIESISSNRSVAVSIEHQSITCISSQANAAELKTLYKELNFCPVNEVRSDQKSVNIFGVLLTMSLKNTTSLTSKCLEANNAFHHNQYTQLNVFDFDVNRPILVKLWRGLSAWITSLSIGCRIQIRNLHVKYSDSLELHSTSNSEICLLAHGDKDGKLSHRAFNLNEKEQLILSYLNHQSLLIKPQKRLPDSSLILSFPFYLEYKDNFWVLQGFLNESFSLVNVRFLYFDAKIWQQFNEIFDSINFSNIIMKFKGLNFNDKFFHEYNMNSSLNITTTTSKTTMLQSSCKLLSWDDLTSSNVIIYGIYRLQGILDTQLNYSSSGESIGNLSIHPVTSQSTQRVLRNPSDNSKFIYPDHIELLTGEGNNYFLINVKSILNDGNTNEVIRKSVVIIKGDGFI